MYMLFSWFKRGVCILLIICSVILMTCCQMPKKKHTEYCFDYFDTLTTVIGFEGNKAEFDKWAKIAIDELGRYHRLFDIHHTYEGINNLATINNNAGGGAVSVDREIIELLEYCKAMYELTDGYVNAAMGSVLSIWHSKRKQAESTPSASSLPDKKDLEVAYKHASIADVIIDKENSTVTLADRDMRLDVGAIAKGYATERVARVLEERGLTGYILNVGGNVRAIGKGPDGAFSVAIENPDTQDKSRPYIEYVGIESASVVTSGVYQRFFTVDGVKYHHIIDKDTLFPAKGYLSVSVITKDSGCADALSTALMCMEIEEGRALVSSLEGVYVMWVLDSGEQVYSEGFSNIRISP